MVASEATEELLEKGIAGIEKRLAKAIEKGKMDEAAKDKLLGNIKTSVDLEELKDCDIVIEAITEDINAKKEVFRELDKICKPEVQKVK